MYQSQHSPPARRTIRSPPFIEPCASTFGLTCNTTEVLPQCCYVHLSPVTSERGPNAWNARQGRDRHQGWQPQLMPCPTGAIAEQRNRRVFETRVQLPAQRYSASAPPPQGTPRGRFPGSAQAWIYARAGGAAVAHPTFAALARQAGGQGAAAVA